VRQTVRLNVVHNKSIIKVYTHIEMEFFLKIDITSRSTVTYLFITNVGLQQKMTYHTIYISFNHSISR